MLFAHDYSDFALAIKRRAYDMSKKKDQEQPETEETTSPEVNPTPVAETFLDRMRHEHEELADRLGKLNGFISSIDFTGVDQEERERLKGQATAMGHYLGILEARIAYHQRIIQG